MRGVAVQIENATNWSSANWESIVNRQAGTALRKASQEKKPGGGLALGGARLMAEGLNPEGSELLVREIVAYNATKIFHAPVSWPEESDDSWVRIQGDAPEYSATLTGELKNYLENGSKLGQFAKRSGTA